ncbi:MAG: hypothetical protein ACOC44_08090 [Promethearchaeia archaeon]
MPNKIKKKSEAEIYEIVKYFDNITSLQIIMGIHRVSGTAFSEVKYNQGENIKANLISGFLTAISSFEEAIGSRMRKEFCKSEKKAVQYGEFTITFFDGESLRIGFITGDLMGEMMKKKCENLLTNYEEKHRRDLENFIGDKDLFSDFSKEIEKELDVELNYPCKINPEMLDKYDGSRSVRKVLENMYEMGDVILPKDLVPILMREAGLTKINAKFYTYDAYSWYVIEPVNQEINVK